MRKIDNIQITWYVFPLCSDQRRSNFWDSSRNSAP